MAVATVNTACRVMRRIKNSTSRKRKKKKEKDKKMRDNSNLVKDTYHVLFWPKNKK